METSKKKLTIEDFMNSSYSDEQEALYAMTGGILGACHASTGGSGSGGGGGGGGNCTGTYTSPTGTCTGGYRY
jgi:hypothetical protein